MSSQILEGSTLRRQTWVPATAVTPQVKHQPLQWNIGSVQRYLVSKLMCASSTSPTALIHAPRCEYMTPVGRPVVPEGELIDSVSSSSSSWLSRGSGAPVARKSAYGSLPAPVSSARPTLTPVSPTGVP